MKRSALLAVCSLLLLADKDPVSHPGNQPVAPFRIAGNLFYVGASDITSYLIATRDGLIVIDGGFEDTAPMILANIRTLGFEPKDVRMLLNTHAHFDHAGGLAELQKATGALIASNPAEARLLARGGKDDPQFGDTYSYPAVNAARIFRDGETIALGGTELVAHITPGHTKGCTTWTLRVPEGGRVWNVVIVGSASVPAGYRIAGNPKYPDAVADYEKTFRTLRSLPCDVFLGSHGGFFDLQGKIARMGGAASPFIDPDGYRKYVDDSEKRFREIVRAGGVSKP
ncbi:MAG: subclass B3 metallo-beta-lactamase [Thermoanaerobaculia bacterium]